MTRGWLVRGAALALLAAAMAWLWRDAPWLREGLSRVVPNAAQPLPTPAAGLRKCLRGNGEVLYTAQPCPAGTRTQAVGGQLSVVPGQAAAPAAAASLPNARALLLKPEAVDIKARRMDEVIGR